MRTNPRQKLYGKVQEFILRAVCVLISTAIIVGVAYFFLHGGVEALKKNEDLRFHAPMIVLAVLSLLTLTTVYAVRGDRAITFIQKLDFW